MGWLRALVNLMFFGLEMPVSEVSLREVDPLRDGKKIDQWFETDQKGFMDAYPHCVRIKLFLIVVGKLKNGKEESIGLIGIFDQLGNDELFIYIAPRARNQGVGKKALRLLLSDPRCPEVLLAATGEKNFGCQKILEQSGFSRVGSDELREHMAAYHLSKQSP